MAQLERREILPGGGAAHLIERVRDRGISVPDLNQLRLCVEMQPEVPRARPSDHRFLRRPTPSVQGSWDTLVPYHLSPIKAIMPSASVPRQLKPS